MSIVANYARLTPSQVVELSGRAVADPNSLISSFPGAEVMTHPRLPCHSKVENSTFYGAWEFAWD
ncbi:hypothetical protein ACFFJ4_19210, partial [Xanthomonas dyei]